MKKHLRTDSELSEFHDQQYIAFFADGTNVPEECILFAGISMGNNKLEGKHLEAFSKLFMSSPAKYKYAYLGDGLQRFNDAAQYILKCVEEEVQLTADSCKPSLFDRGPKKRGNIWCNANSSKFGTSKSSNTIIRDSEIVIDQRFNQYLSKTVELYLNPVNVEFIKAVDATVKSYMTRNGYTVGRNNILLTLPNNDPIGKCVDAFIQRKKQTAKNSDDVSYLNNPIQQSLLRLSYCYVLYELSGFHLSIDKLRQHIDPKHRDFPIIFIYPGNLIVVQRFFELLPGFTLKTKEVDYKSYHPSESPEKRGKKGSPMGSNSPEDTLSSGSPPSPQEVLMLVASKRLAQNGYGDEEALADIRKYTSAPARKNLFIEQNWHEQAMDSTLPYKEDDGDLDSHLGQQLNHK